MRWHYQVLFFIFQISNGNPTGRKLWTNSTKRYDRPIPSNYTSNTAIEEAYNYGGGVRNKIIVSESELISVLTKQLHAAESQLQKTQSAAIKTEERLQAKEQEVTRLKQKVKEWEFKSKNQELLRKKEQQQRRNQIENSEYLYKRCLTLEHKIYGMEKFLADYGLVWVGENKDADNSEKNCNYIESCYDQIKANIDQLNLAAGKGEVKIQRNEKGNGASFKILFINPFTYKTSACISVKFYKNGIVVQNGHLRSYNDPSIRSFIQDILDGYFPSELQAAHPNGVPFKIEDHRKQTYLEYGIDFPGHGYRLGKQLVDKKSISSVDGSTTLQRTESSSHTIRQNFFSSEASPMSLQFSARSLKSKTSNEAPQLDIVSLRSQILASHNNVCSDVHLQSHINAELALSSRKEKRDSVVKSTDYDLLLGESYVKPSINTMKFPSSRRRSYHSSMDRSSTKSSPCFDLIYSRLEIDKDKTRSRSRSTSLSTRRFSLNTLSSGSNINTLKNIKSFEGNDSDSQLHASRSTTPARKATPPLLHQINEPTGDASELRLKVRSLNGGIIYLVHVSANEMVSRLYKLLDNAMSKSLNKGYKIVINGYSPKRLDQLEITLRESGITTDSVLHLVND
ncbi:uncharacterized protein [Prorops nasuta]|uniref:uncharacterized protein n=1 Tax=Prorops nasuta TaxID=863751 RepID=UPI0034CD36FF